MTNISSEVKKKYWDMPLGKGLYLHTKAARITQTTSRALSYWARTKLVTPHIHSRDGGPSIYSYNDLLAIRAVVRLREERLPLQKIRKAIRYFYDNVNSIEWWNLKMVVYRKRDLIVVIPSDQTPSGEDEVVIATRGGQRSIEIMFGDLVSDLLKGGELENNPDIPRYIEIDGLVQAGAPVIKGTRIKTSVIYYWHECGLSEDEISELYIGLDRNAIRVAISYEELLNRCN
ncbi:MAG: hypothetical protein A2158_05510 [Chloroflexi bacterium RBG_13_46_14]|nr:MAG: hypothetical protein A2158_05510 [Chloroflexi bacterium RBG_13_46_14]